MFQKSIECDYFLVSLSLSCSVNYMNYLKEKNELKNSLLFTSKTRETRTRGNFFLNFVKIIEN